jgi:succinate dehydrogenase flavin-adding protein (antitoxin of CptAB toxin-antitoxin module)|tara:strand:- start:156 stop:257 length:102 start_codon:yes stop_codon:yes gene_type:complete
MNYLDKALSSLSGDALEEYEELIELWIWYGGCG